MSDLESFSPEALRHPMHVLVLASQKGGSDKTTLSGHLAVEAEPPFWDASTSTCIG